MVTEYIYRIIRVLILYIPKYKKDNSQLYLGKYKIRRVMNAGNEYIEYRTTEPYGFFGDEYMVAGWHYSSKEEAMKALDRLEERETFNRNNQ
jgi:hypothetical protein